MCSTKLKVAGFEFAADYHKRKAQLPQIMRLMEKDALAEKNAQQRDAELAAKDAELEAAMVAKDAALKKVADLERLLGAAASDRNEQ